MTILGRSISRHELERRPGHLQQIGGTRHFELSSGRAKGMRGIEVNTGPGSDMTYFGDPERDGEKELGLHRHYAGLAAAVIQDNSRTDSLPYLNEWKMLHEGDRGVFRRDSEGDRTEKE